MFILNSQEGDMSAKKLGDCFEVAANIVTIGREFENPLLCHGHVIGTGGPVVGVRYCHGWVEVDELVIDRTSGRDIKVDKDLYYILGQINHEEVVRYTKDEAKKMLLKSEHYGPWELSSNCPCENLMCREEEL